MASPKTEWALAALFESWAGVPPDLILPLAPSGSDRIYYRLQKNDKVAIGTYSPHEKESLAFLHFSKHFHERNLPVPAIYAENLAAKVYLQEDLGSTTLYSFLLQNQQQFPEHLMQLYKKVVEKLAHLQISGAKDLKYTYCFPKESFDRESMFWDFNYFKYHFLLPSSVGFDEVALEKDFHRLADFLLEADNEYFMFRDFQSRNILIRNGNPYFIDYQGGRKGALQYDLASLLYQAKANIPVDIKESLINHYLDTASKLTSIDRTSFLSFFYGYVLMRNIQVLGAYGFRGIYERKAHFLLSIPYGLKNIQWLLEESKIPLSLPELTRCLQNIIDSQKYNPFDKSMGENSLLKVYINSFSYHKRAIPVESSGNGGGFVFDCRFLHNPGRYEPYKKLSGKDESVINFLKHFSEMDSFLNNTYSIVDAAVENYLERSFTHLEINFGCTGGQHRSVYAADQMAAHLKEKYGLHIILNHLEQSSWAKEG
jgi:aminoglycoside/choline kinase family phosphotransferase